MTGARLLVALSLTVALAGCDQKQMAEHGREKPYKSAAPRRPPAGTVARDDFIGPRAPKPDVTMAQLARGRDLFDGICAPCHSRLGDGDGIVVRRGFPRPPTFHQKRLRDADDTLFYDTITDGYGVMYPYPNRVAPADRWAITYYIRALQLSQDAKLADLPADLRRTLTAAPGTAK